VVKKNKRNRAASTGSRRGKRLYQLRNCHPERLIGKKRKAGGGHENS